MAIEPTPSAAERMAGVNCRMPVALLRLVDTLRAAIQRDLAGTTPVSRGDLVRLALRRLVLAYANHLCETGSHLEAVQLDAERIIADIHAEATCPAWLVPGHPEETIKSKKKGR